MFYELIIELFAANTFDPKDIPDFKIAENSTLWIQNLLLESPGQHSPLYQPGWLRELLIRILAVAESRPEDWPVTGAPPEALMILLGFLITIQSSNSRNSLVRYDYDYNGFKFKDTCTLQDGILNKTIAEANESYTESNGYKFLNLSTYIVLDDAITFDYPALTFDGLVLTFGGEVLTLDA
jgi:hypothetical protein